MTDGDRCVDDRWRLPAGDTLHLKMLIPATAAGAIIGKGGETIMMIQKESGANIKMSKANDYYPGKLIKSMGNVCTFSSFIAVSLCGVTGLAEIFTSSVVHSSPILQAFVSLLTVSFHRNLGCFPYIFILAIALWCFPFHLFFSRARTIPTFSWSSLSVPPLLPPISANFCSSLTLLPFAFHLLPTLAMFRRGKATPVEPIFGKSQRGFTHLPQFELVSRFVKSMQWFGCWSSLYVSAGTTERVCLITGSLESVKQVYLYVMDKVRGKPEGQQPVDTEMKVSFALVDFILYWYGH